jgi:predicted dinucleotide-binding enzyme
MRIGIIGAGAIGQTVGRLLAAGGHDVIVSWSSVTPGYASPHSGSGSAPAQQHPPRRL